MNEQTEPTAAVTVEIRSSSTNPKNPPGVTVRATDLANKAKKDIACEAAWAAWLDIHDKLEHDEMATWKQSLAKEQS